MSRSCNVVKLAPDVLVQCCYQSRCFYRLGLELSNQTMQAAKDGATIDVSQSYMFQHNLQVEAKNALGSSTNVAWPIYPFNTGKCHWNMGTRQLAAQNAIRRENVCPN